MQNIEDGNRTGRWKVWECFKAGSKWWKRLGEIEEYGLWKDWWWGDGVRRKVGNEIETSFWNDIWERV